MPWDNEGAAAVPRDCLCADESGIIPFTFISTAHVVELRFDVMWMNSTDDYSTTFFEGTWEFIRKPVCVKNLKKIGSSGDLYFRSPSRTPEEVSLHQWNSQVTTGKKFLAPNFRHFWHQNNPGTGARYRHYCGGRYPIC